MKIPEKLEQSTIALLAANAALAGIILLDWLYPPEPSLSDEAVTAMAPDISMPDLAKTDYVAPGLDELGAMLERPLFFDDRRMPAPPEVQVAGPAAQPLRLKLEGVAIVGDARIAVLRDTEKNTLLQLAEGTTHEDWTLEAVTASMARFSRGPQTSEILLNPEPLARR